MSEVGITIGYRYRGWDGGVFLIERYDARYDYQVVCVEETAQECLGSRKQGERFFISPRAVGRTYHRIDWDEEGQPHVQPCDCRFCKNPEEGRQNEGARSSSRA